MIRRFEPRDLSRVYEIERKSFRDPYNVLFLFELHELYPDTFLVAEKNGEVAGYIVARQVNYSGHVLAVAVDPRYRRTGIGRKLVESVIKKLGERGAKYMWLEVRASNSAAIKFYEKLGFEKKKFIEGYYSDGEAAVILKKVLQKSSYLGLAPLS